MSGRKVIVRFKNVGGAAELPEDKLQVKCNPSDTLSQLHDWLCKWYPESPKVALCIYVKSCFMPALEEEVGALAQAYGVTTRTGGAKVLMLEYCNQPNWGPHYFTASTPSAGS